jgi:heat shock protein HtpX
MEKISFHDQIVRNKRNSVFLMIFVLAFTVLIGFVIGEIYDPSIALLFIIAAAIIGIAQVSYSYYNGDKMVLKITNARPANTIDVKEKHLENVVEGLAIAAGIKAPKVYVIDSEEMNAFATGRSPENSSVAITTGLLNKLNREELEGVIAHELSHVRNYDIRFATFIAIAVGLVAILSYFFMRSMWFGGGRHDSRERGSSAGLIIIVGLILAIVAPILVRLIQMAISRQREYLADASSAQLTRYPVGLANALAKIKNVNKGNMDVPEAISHLFFVDPTKTYLDSLYATHPPIEKRIEILRKM